MPVLSYSLGTNAYAQTSNLCANFQEAPKPGNHAAQALVPGQMTEGQVSGRKEGRGDCHTLLWSPPKRSRPPPSL